MQENIFTKLTQLLITLLTHGPGERSIIELAAVSASTLSVGLLARFIRQDRTPVARHPGADDGLYGLSNDRVSEQAANGILCYLTQLHGIVEFSLGC